jgi:hypothetical protein
MMNICNSLIINNLNKMKLKNLNINYVMKTKNLFFIVISFTLLIINTDIIGQNNSYSVNSQTLYKHGNNSTGVSVYETIDSVTTGGTTRYWIYPDLSLNAGYDPSNPLTTTLTSSFTWAATNTSGTAAGTVSAVGTYGAYQNYKQVSWTGLGTINLSSTEKSGVSGNCDGTAKVIAVEVIDKPTPNFPAAGGSNSTCGTGADGSLSIAVPALNINFNSVVKNGNRQMKLTYDVTCSNAGFTAVSGHQVNINEAAGTFTLASNLTHYGTYTITLKTVSDRISVKSNVTANASGNVTYTYYVFPTPSSGPIYHIPNQ